MTRLRQAAAGVRHSMVDKWKEGKNYIQGWGKGSVFKEAEWCSVHDSDDKCRMTHQAQ